MAKIVLLIIMIVAIAGGLFFVSTLPKEQPTRQIEAPVGGDVH